MCQKVVIQRNTCVVATCPLQILENGVLTTPQNFIQCTNFTETGQCDVNTTLLYYCLVHNLVGDAVITCTEDNTWYPPLGTCTPGK